MTVQNHWPFAPTLFDYVKRAMPFTEPASLNNDQVYALTAYILSVAGIVTVETVMDAATLAAVEMPNRDGFVPDPRPDTSTHP
jgi:cytochrome c